MAACTRRATRNYRAKRRNGNYNTTPNGETSKRKKYGQLKHDLDLGSRSLSAFVNLKRSSHLVPIYHVRRKLHFGRAPPKHRADGSPSKLKSSENKSKKGTNSPSKAGSPAKKQLHLSKRIKHKHISKEVYELLQMSSCYVLPNRLRSLPRCSGHCHGDGKSGFRGYKLHISPEHTNLSRIE